jgi:hypothetical protein
MSPTEQLIRDYLSRLSVAARGQLGAGDRRALVDRTREFIERKTEADGPPTALDVGKLLYRLGDPAGLVSQERQRLETLRGEALGPVSRGRLARVLLGEPGKVRGANWHWLVQPGSRADLQIRQIDAAAPEAGPAATARAAAGREAASPEAAGQLVPSPAPPADPAPARPLWPALAAGAAHGGTIGRDTAGPDTGRREIVDEIDDDEIVDGEIVDGDDGAHGTGERDTDRQELNHRVPDHQSPTQNVRTAVPDARPAGLAAMNWQVGPAAPPRLSRSLQRLAKVAGWSQRHKLEAVAIALLGLGGAIFPPVWFLGAVVALASGLWDYRDKWTALALPILLTVMATAVGIAVGSRVSFGHGMHVAWVFAVGFSRATAVLSACYLGWRAGRGPRPAARPPWDRPHRVT